MILEGIVTTLNADGTTNVSPMGPLVDESMTRLVLRPYRTSTTLANLRRTREGVLHVTDDVLLFAQAAVGQPDPPPQFIPAQSVRGNILADACRWYAFRTLSIDETSERTEIVAEVVDRGVLREFFGFNRAKHAVVEAAILASRVAILPAERIERELAALRALVDKTGGVREAEAFEFLVRYVRRAIESGTCKNSAESI